LGLEGLNYQDILKDTLRAAIKITPITAAPQISLHLGERKPSPLSLSTHLCCAPC